MPTVCQMLRPREDFPTPLFRLALPLLAAAVALLVYYLAIA